MERYRECEDQDDNISSPRSSLSDTLELHSGESSPTLRMARLQTTRVKKFMHFKSPKEKVTSELSLNLINIPTRLSIATPSQCKNLTSMDYALQAQNQRGCSLSSSSVSYPSQLSSSEK